MVKYFQYDAAPQEALEICRATLDSLGYSIDIFAPESRLLITAPQLVKKDIRRFSYALIVQVQDVIQVYIVAKRHIFKRGSELSIGGRELTEMQTTDRLPYSIQQKIYWPIIEIFNKHGILEYNRELTTLKLGIAPVTVTVPNSFSIFKVV